MTKVTYIVSDIDKALAFEWIATRINKAAFQVSFILIVQNPSELGAFLKENGIQTDIISYKEKKDLIHVFGKVYRLLSAKRPDVVHCHLFYGALIGLSASWLAGIRKRIYTRHHSDYHQRYFPKGIKWDKLCNNLATHIVAPSGAVKEVLIDREKVARSKIIVIHHGFDLAYFENVPGERVENLKNKYNTKGFYPVVGVISRFTELKGIQYIIPAFDQLLNHYPKALLLLFNARGDYEQVVKERLSTVAKGSYRLIPFEKDLAAVYRLFDVFVQVSTDRTIEAFGQTYVEALASGVPSVFTLSGIAPDFIGDNKNALVVPFKDSEAIYQALLKIVGNNTLRQKLVLHGRESVQDKFSLNIMIQKLEALYAGK